MWACQGKQAHMSGLSILETGSLGTFVLDAEFPPLSPVSSPPPLFIMASIPVLE